MATEAHCAFAFECLVANFQRRQPLSLAQVEELWTKYHASKTSNDVSVEESQSENEENEDAEMTDVEADDPAVARPAAISQLLHRESANAASAASSNSSLLSMRSTTSSTPSGRRSGSGVDTPASSRSSIFSLGRSRREKKEEHPLFVTWNTISRSGHKSLRGCIGTFEPQELEYGLRSYALTRLSFTLCVTLNLADGCTVLLKTSAFLLYLPPFCLA